MPRAPRSHSGAPIVGGLLGVPRRSPHGVAAGLALALAAGAAEAQDEAPTGPPPDPVEVLGQDAFPPDTGPLDAGPEGRTGPGELERLGDLLRGEAEPSGKTELEARVTPRTFYASDDVLDADFEWPEPSVLDPDVWTLGGHVGGEQLSRTGISDNPGTVETRRILLGAGLRRPTSDGGLFLAEYNFESSNYRFDNAIDVIFNSTQPIEDLVQNRFGVHWQDRPDAKFSLATSLEFALGSEPNAEFTDSIALAGALAGTWRPDPDRPFGVTVGAWGTTEMAGDATVLPILGLEWEIDERTRLGTTLRAPREFRPALNQAGPGLILERDLGRSTSAFLRARYRDHQYALDEVGPLPEGSFREQEVQVTLGLDWSPGIEWGPIAGSWASFWVGSNVRRELTWYDASEVEFQSRDVDGGAVFGFAVRLTF